MEIKKLSVTQISTGLECQLKLKYQMTEPKPPKNEYLFMGSVFHSALEVYFTERAHSGRDMTWGELEKEFNEIWKRGKGEVKFTKMSEIQALQRARACLLNYHRERCRLLYPKNRRGGSLLIEVFFKSKVKLNGRELYISGKGDLVTKSDIAVDHKTTGSLNKWNQEKANKEIQGQLYPICLRLQGIKVNGFQFNIAAPEGVAVYDVDVTQERGESIIRDAFSIKRDMEENNLSAAKNRKLCAYCDYRSLCREWKQEERVEEIEGL